MQISENSILYKEINIEVFKTHLGSNLSLNILGYLLIIRFNFMRLNDTVELCQYKCKDEEGG